MLTPQDRVQDQCLVFGLALQESNLVSTQHWDFHRSANIVVRLLLFKNYSCTRGWVTFSSLGLLHMNGNTTEWVCRLQREEEVLLGKTSWAHNHKCLSDLWKCQVLYIQSFIPFTVLEEHQQLLPNFCLQCCVTIKLCIAFRLCPGLGHFAPKVHLPIATYTFFFFN